MGIQKLSPTRFRVFIELGRDGKERVRYTQIVHGDRAAAERVESGLIAVRDSATASGEDRDVLFWLEGLAGEANRRAREVVDDRVAVGLVNLACLAREIVWNLDGVAQSHRGV